MRWLRNLWRRAPASPPTPLTAKEAKWALIVKLLEERPGEWSVVKDELQHTSGLRIWTGCGGHLWRGSDLEKPAPRFDAALKRAMAVVLEHASEMRAAEELNALLDKVEPTLIAGSQA